MELKEIEMYAKKAHVGFIAGRLTNPQMGITHAENQRIRRQMKSDSFEGSIHSYIGLKCLNVLTELICERDETVLFEKLRLKNSEKQKKISELLELDVEKISKSISNRTSKDVIEKRLQAIDQSIYCCASFFILSKLSSKSELSSHIFYRLFELIK